MNICELNIDLEDCML